MVVVSVVLLPICCCCCCCYYKVYIHCYCCCCDCCFVVVFVLCLLLCFHVVMLLSKLEAGETFKKRGGPNSGTTSGQNQRGQLCFQLSKIMVFLFFVVFCCL